ncbi:MAG: hypothetical protein KDD44_03090, partial [Bdellovibrionales bacterium]|nr:hypothetical protein [Bdellovibrionales bacterium]
MPLARSVANPFPSTRNYSQLALGRSLRMSLIPSHPLQRLQTVLCALLWLLIPAIASAQFSFPGNDYVRLSLVADREVIQPSSEEGEPAVRLGIQFDIDPGWHIYWRNSGDSGQPTKVTWELPAGWKAHDLEWPIPLRIVEAETIATFGFNESALLVAPVESPLSYPPEDEQITFRATVSWLVCHEVCLPGKANVEATFPFSTEQPSTPSEHAQDFLDVAMQQPRSIGEARTLSPALRDFSQQTALFVGSKTPEDPARIHIETRGLPGISTETVQLFPYEERSVEFLAPKLATSSPTSGLLLLPFRRLDPGSAIPPISGITVLSPTITGLTHPVAISWPQGDAAPAAHSEQSSYPNSRELNYRRIPSLSSPSNRATASRDSIERQPTAKHSTTPFGWAFVVALVTGFFAGIILNLMPCVLPMISIKIMGFINKRGVSRSEAIRGASAFSAGIVFTFLLLAAIVVALREIGMQVGWGFQFQQPVFVVAVFLVVFVLSLIFFDVYTFQIPYLQRANRAIATRPEAQLSTQFFEGILVCALSTPCTAPFLGTALAFAFSQSGWVTFTIFGA